MGSGPNNIDSALDKYQRGASVENVIDDDGTLLGFKVSDDATSAEVIPGRELYMMEDTVVQRPIVQ